MRSFFLYFLEKSVYKDITCGIIEITKISLVKKELENLKSFNELNITNSTIIDWKGKELRTIQDPYSDFDDQLETRIYIGHALDSEGNEYKVVWEQLESFEYENADESEACDWENPKSVEKLGE